MILCHPNPVHPMVLASNMKLKGWPRKDAFRYDLFEF